MPEEGTGSSGARTLDYGTGRRRLWRGRAVRVVILVALTAAAWHWGPAGFDRARVLYYQSQCDRYAGAPDEKPSEDPPGCLKGLDPRYGRYRGDRYLFVHRLVSKSGNSRLVVVTGNVDPYSPRYDERPLSRKPFQILEATAHVMSPATWSSQLGQTSALMPSITVELGPGDHAEVFNGQPDQFDSSHFTLAYEIEGKRGTIDLYLLDNDYVFQQVRDGPAKALATTQSTSK